MQLYKFTIQFMQLLCNILINVLFSISDFNHLFMYIYINELLKLEIENMYIYIYIQIYMYISKLITFH